MNRPALPLRLLVTALCLLLILPIAIIVVVSFGGDGYLRFPPSSLSLQWYTRFFGSSGWWHSICSSVMIALIASAISTTIGFLAAYVLVRGRFRFKTLLLCTAMMPMIVPQVITAIAMFYAATRLGLVGSLPWIAVCHSVIALPIVLLILLSTIQGIDVTLERAAAGMGYGQAQIFLRVVVPLALPGVISAGLFAFLASFDELVIALFLSGISTETLPVRIWNSLLLQVEPTIAAVSTFLVAITVIVLLADWAIGKLTGRLDRKVGVS